MPIEVEHDNTSRWEPAEECAFCSGETHFWYTPKDVAVCRSCARYVTAKDVPSKKRWFAGFRVGNPRLPKTETTPRFYVTTINDGAYITTSAPETVEFEGEIITRLDLRKVVVRIGADVARAEQLVAAWNTAAGYPPNSYPAPPRRKAA